MLININNYIIESTFFNIYKKNANQLFYIDIFYDDVDKEPLINNFFNDLKNITIFQIENNNIFEQKIIIKQFYNKSQHIIMLIQEENSNGN